MNNKTVKILNRKLKDAKAQVVAGFKNNKTRKSFTRNDKKESRLFEGHQRCLTRKCSKEQKATLDFIYNGISETRKKYPQISGRELEKRRDRELEKLTEVKKKCFRTKCFKERKALLDVRHTMNIKYGSGLL
jgi:hypothetical protein